MLIRKKSLVSTQTLIKKVKATMFDVYKHRADLEKILAEGNPEEFGELKLNEWDNFDYLMADNIMQIRDEVQTLISSTTAYMKDDANESQAEIIKVATEAKRLKNEIDQTNQ